MKTASTSNRPILVCLAFLVILAGLAISAGAQQMMTLQSADGFFMPEIMGMVEGKDKQVVIVNKLPAATLPKEYQDIDIIKGDIIMMINGKKVASASELEKIYNEIGIGGEVKLGIKRDGVPRLVSFKKADPKSMPMMRRVVMGGEGAAADSSAGSGQKIIRMTPGGDIFPLPEIGLIISTKDSVLKVEMVMPMGEKKAFSEALQEGDIIRTIQGKNVTKKDEFQKIYDGLAIGESGQMTFERAGKLISTNFTKLQSSNMMIKK
jgi:S1-C subfamily serine protease